MVLPGRRQTPLPTVAQALQFVYCFIIEPTVRNGGGPHETTIQGDVYAAAKEGGWQYLYDTMKSVFSNNDGKCRTDNIAPQGQTWGITVFDDSGNKLGPDRVLKARVLSLDNEYEGRKVLAYFNGRFKLRNVHPVNPENFRMARERFQREWQGYCPQNHHPSFGRTLESVMSGEPYRS